MDLNISPRERQDMPALPTRLTPCEIESLRLEMQQSGAWMKDWLVNNRQDPKILALKAAVANAAVV